MNSEKQPLLGGTESENEPSRTLPPRPDIRNSPENALVEVQSEIESGLYQLFMIFFSSKIL